MKVYREVDLGVQGASQSPNREKRHSGLGVEPPKASFNHRQPPNRPRPPPTLFSSHLYSFRDLLYFSYYFDSLG